MKILLLSVGAVKKPFYKAGIDEYLKRIKRYASIESAEVKDETASLKMPRTEVLRREGERLGKRLLNTDYLVTLIDGSSGGKNFSTEKFSRYMEDTLSAASGRAIGKKRLVFIVGGAYGLSPELLDRSELRLSLSAMTLPHELARLVLAEQLYRAFTVIRGEPYSH